MADAIRWGIIGTGNISCKFAEGLAGVPDAQLVAVGSRTQEAADGFGEVFNVPRRYDSYEALAADSDVQAVYIGTPHPLHDENTLMCLDAGKAVLCEKPFTINAKETVKVIQAARDKGLFLMEAMWTRFLPAVATAYDRIQRGDIGEPRMLTADFGFRTGFDPKGRLFDPELGGGGLLDVGIYPLSLASWIFGTPATIASAAHLGETGVDEQAALVLGYEGGRLALLSCATRTDTPQEAVINGTEGRIRIHSPWWWATTYTLEAPGKAPETVKLSYIANGYSHEAMEVMRCMRAGKLESDIMPLDETLSLMQTMDSIRAQWGLVYPGE